MSKYTLTPCGHIKLTCVNSPSKHVGLKSFYQFEVYREGGSERRKQQSKAIRRELTPACRTLQENGSRASSRPACETANALIAFFTSAIYIVQFSSVPVARFGERSELLARLALNRPHSCTARRRQASWLRFFTCCVLRSTSRTLGQTTALIGRLAAV